MKTYQMTVSNSPDLPTVERALAAIPGVVSVKADESGTVVRAEDTLSTNALREQARELGLSLEMTARDEKTEKI